MTEIFNYQILDPDIQENVQQLTQQIKNRLQRCAEDIIYIGNHLCQIKQQLPHGQFRLWLKAEFGGSFSAAQKFMQVSKCFQIEDIKESEIAPSSLYLLAAPSTPESVRYQVLQEAKKGGKIRFSWVKQLIKDSKIEDDSAKELVLIENSSNLARLTIESPECLVIEAKLSYTKKLSTLSDVHDSLQKQWEKMEKNHQKLSIVVCQINFKLSSSTAPKETEVIGQITENFADFLRRPSDFVSYYGHHQWLLVLPHANTTGIHSVVTRCSNWFQQYQFSSANFEDFSIGWATLSPNDHSSWEMLIKTAQSSLKPVNFSPDHLVA